MGDGSMIRIPNPLYSFTIPKDAGIKLSEVQSGDETYIYSNTTARWPSENGGTSDRAAFEEALDLERSSLAVRLRSVLLSPKDRNWPCFSSHFSNSIKSGMILASSTPVQSHWLKQLANRHYAQYIIRTLKISAGREASKYLDRML